MLFLVLILRRYYLLILRLEIIIRDLLKELLNIYINKWKIEKNKFNILFNKYDKNCIDINLLKELFCEFNVLGTLKYNDKYNKLINKNIKYNLINKNIRNEYLEVNKKLVLNEKGERYEFRK